MLSRRRFLKILTAFSNILLWRDFAWAETFSLRLDRVKKLGKVGGSVILKVKGAEVLFIRESENRIRALNPTCTHKGCTVGYDKKRKMIVCPCHKSGYDLDGTVLEGPAPRSLKAFPVVLEGGNIIFTLND